MKVILCEDVDNLGDMGQTVNVAPGYARNFLLPRRLAVPVESSSAKALAHEMTIIRRREERRKAELASVAKGLEGQTFEVRVRAGAHDKLYGSVTTAQIAEALQAAGHKVARRSVLLAEPIKQLGMYTVAVKLGSGVQSNIKVWVKPLEVAVVAEQEEAHSVSDFAEEEFDSMAARDAAQAKADAKRAAKLAAQQATAAEAGGTAEAPAEAAAEATDTGAPAGEEAAANA